MLERIKNVNWKVALPIVVVIVLLTVVLAACGGEAPAPGGAKGGEEEAAPPPDLSGGDVSATGVVVPAEDATLSFATSGQVVELLVEVGDEVSEGDVIARLDSTIVDAELARAEAGVTVAEANLARAEAGPRPEQIDEAKQNLQAASAETARAAAERDQVQSGASEVEIANARADVQAAFIGWLGTRSQHDYIDFVLQDPDNFNDFNFFNRNKWTDELLDDAQDQMDFAYLNLQASQAYLDSLLDGPNPDELAVAQANLWAASADYQAQQAQLNLLLVGPRDEDVAIAEAALEQAEAARQAAEVAAERVVLVAPYDGTIAEVYIQQSQFANAGAPIALIADLTTLRIETTDLNEIDLAGVDVGDEAQIEFDALPGVERTGTISYIAPKAEEGAGVNYTVWVELDDFPPEVRWGMTAFVDIPRD